MTSSARTRFANTGPSETWNSPSFWLNTRVPDDVRRNEVRGELDALELAADRLRERLHRHRLRKPGNAFHEQVAPREKGDDHPLEQRILADDHALDLVQDLFEGRVECGLCVHGSSRHLGGASAAPPAAPIGTAKPMPEKYPSRAGLASPVTIPIT